MRCSRLDFPQPTFKQEQEDVSCADINPITEPLKLLLEVLVGTNPALRRWAAEQVAVAHRTISSGQYDVMFVSDPGHVESESAATEIALVSPQCDAKSLLGSHRVGM